MKSCLGRKSSRDCVLSAIVRFLQLPVFPKQVVQLHVPRKVYAAFRNVKDCLFSLPVSQPQGAADRLHVLVGDLVASSHPGKCFLEPHAQYAFFFFAFGFVFVYVCFVGDLFGVPIFFFAAAERFFWCAIGFSSR